MSVAPLKTHLVAKHNILEPREATLAPATRTWFKASEYASIYGMPAPSMSRNPVVGIVSFGGGLYGSVSPDGILTSGDCKDYWNYLGMGSHPVVKIVGVGGATNSPASGGTDENSLDVQMVGACCPTSRLTIILYLVPNSLSNFTVVMDYILNTPVSVNGTSVKPGYISISWGAPEIYYSNTLLASINTRFATAAAAGIPITAAAGDNGSTDGTSGNCCDFPSSSPNIVACGGTNLFCPNYTYDGATTETTWSSSGGAVSGYFAKPAYQSVLTGTGRHTPDIALNADPATGVVFIVNCQYVV
jgi:kumamolisin